MPYWYTGVMAFRLDNGINNQPDVINIRRIRGCRSMMLYWYTGVMMLRVDDGVNNQARR